VRFKVDENLPVELAEILRQGGHDAFTVGDEQLAGSSDDTLAATCRQEARVLVTLDLDFANVCAYPPSDHPGIIVLRLARQDKPHVLRVFSGLFALLASEPLEKHLWIVSETGIRIRPS